MTNNNNPNFRPEPLKCFCDACPNNTCETSAHDDGYCFARIRLDGSDLVKTYGCFPSTTNVPTLTQNQPLLNSTDPQLESNGAGFIIRRMVCGTDVSDILRCCRSYDFCNKNATLLPPDPEARLTLQRKLPPTNSPLPLLIQYSSLSLTLKVCVILLSGLLLVISLALARSKLSKRRSRRSQSPRLRTPPSDSNIRNNNGNIQYSPINDPHLSLAGRRTDSALPDVSPDSMAISAPLTTGKTTSATQKATKKLSPTAKSDTNSNIIKSHKSKHKHVEDHSENSSGKVNFDVAVFDTNSMASREPLINNYAGNTSQNPNQSNCFSMSMNHFYSSNSQPNQYRGGPYMMTEASTCASRPPSTFQMTIGSGSVYNKQETSSGSGAGQPYLTQRSIAHDTELLEVVGRGYFGVVYRGEYKGEPVAVKIFSPMAEPSWEREAEIYQTTMLRHKNILGFIATDKKHDAGFTGYWLVTDYYPMGSLYDFLKDNSTSMQDALRMAFSIANGLSHLHMEIFGTFGKPAIAHRDMKSKNILVKNDGTCCIADLGMAVRYNSSSNVVDVPTNTRVGTRRYLAPELLDNRVNLMDFEAIKATDIYAVGLVLWELLRRACLVHPSTNRGLDPNYLQMLNQQQLVAAKSTEPLATQNPPADQVSNPVSTVEEPPQVPSSVHSAPSVTGEDSKEDNGTSTKENEQPQQQRLTNSPETTNATANEFTMNSTATTTSYEPPESSIEDMEHDLAMLCEPYEAPYQNYVSIDPSAEEMREIVCVRKIRPPISYRWTKFAPMRDYVTLMSECWYEKPQARLSALRIRKSLGDIARHYFNLNMEYD